MFSLFKKEISAFLSSALGYIAIITFLISTGVFMWIFPSYGISEVLITSNNIFDMGESSMKSFFNMAPNIFLFLIPAITMKLFAEEKNTGTIELLFTKPISELKVVLSKFLAASFLVFISILPTLIFYYSIIKMGNSNIDHAATWGGYIGLLMLGAVFVAIGLFSSAITNNQVIAFITSMFLCFMFYLGFSFISEIISSPFDYFLLKISVFEHYSSLQRGVIDSRDIIYYLSIIVFFLFSTATIIKRR